MALNVGDRIRFSMDLVQEYCARPDHLSPVLTIIEIGEDENGFKTIRMGRTSADLQESIKKPEDPAVYRRMLRERHVPNWPRKE